MKLRHLKSPQQVIVTINYNEHWFFSYGTLIAKEIKHEITLDEYYWNYSRTTSKYLAEFLGVTNLELHKNVKNGIYKFENLN